MEYVGTILSYRVRSCGFNQRQNISAAEEHKMLTSLFDSALWEGSEK